MHLAERKKLSYPKKECYENEDLFYIHSDKLTNTNFKKSLFRNFKNIYLAHLQDVIVCSVPVKYELQV